MSETNLKFETLQLHAGQRSRLGNNRFTCGTTISNQLHMYLLMPGARRKPVSR